MSSAKSNAGNSFNGKLELIDSAKGSMNMENNNGESIPPCKSPLSSDIYSVNIPFTRRIKKKMKS